MVQDESYSPKITIVGTGNVGSTCAFGIVERGLARSLVLVDLRRDRAEGDAMDLAHGMSFTKPAEIIAGDYPQTANSDVVIIAAGVNQEPGQSRLDLIGENYRVFQQIVPPVVGYSPQAVILVVTNPVDVLTLATLRISGLPENQVIGSGTVLDTSRLRYEIAEQCNVDARSVHAYIVGEHGDSELAVWSRATIGGTSLDVACARCDLCPRLDRQKILARVRNAANVIIEKKGATYYAVALGVLAIVESIIRDENRVLAVSSLLEDYCGVSGVCLSVPAVVGRGGRERLIPLDLDPQEQQAFLASATAVGEVAARVGIL